MTQMLNTRLISVTGFGWLSAFLAGVLAPALAMITLAAPGAAGPLGATIGPIVAVGLMGTGMIAAALAGRLWVGLALALFAGAGLLLLARGLGMSSLPDPLPVGVVFCIAGTSFAARGTLFARSAGDKGWWIALAVVAGEAAIVASAWVKPDSLPDWLLVLLPAQWASMAIHSALTDPRLLVTSAPLLALGGTATTTMLVIGLWPRRWPYLLMFSAWLGLSAVVYFQSGLS